MRGTDFQHLMLSTNVVNAEAARAAMRPKNERKPDLSSFPFNELEPTSRFELLTC
jgi:hypothetical protein